MRTLLLTFALWLFLPGPLLAVTQTWTGAASKFWSDPQNWSPQAVPAAGDALIFPAGAANRSAMTNDLPTGTTFGPMTFNASYTLAGNPLTLTADVSFGSGPLAVIFTCNADLRLAAPLKLGAAVISSTYNGAIDVNDQTLTIDSNMTTIAGPLNGDGAVVINGEGVLINGSGTFAGTISGRLNVRGSIPDATVTSNRLSGTGRLGNTTAGELSPGNEFLCCGFPPHYGVLHTKSLVLNGPTRLDLFTGQLMDQLQVDGSVTIGGQLTVNIFNFAPAEGNSFVVIDNDGTDAVNGIFSGLPEGARFSASVPVPISSALFSITYRGGDGNDVVLRAVSATISTAGAQIMEGNSGTTTVTLPLTLSSPASVPVRVSFTTLAGSATSGVDYESGSGVIEFEPGEQTRSVEVRIIGDLLFEPDETFLVILSDPLNATVGTPSSALVVIDNDDAPAARRRAARH